MLVLGACSGEQRVETPELVDVMPIVPLPPDSRLVARLGSDDALQFTFQSRHKEEDLVAYYRGMFIKEPWTLISDAKGPEGEIILYAENDGTPLWVRIARTAGAPGSTVQLSGALVSSDAALVDSLPPSSDDQ